MAKKPAKSTKSHEARGQGREEARCEAGCEEGGREARQEGRQGRPRPSSSTSSAAARPTATGTMKDVLGGKGSGLAEMTNAGLPVPPGFTISTAACNLWYDEGTQAAAGDRRRDDVARPPAREARRVAVRQHDEPAARVGALGREVLDARHDGHHPQPRPERPRRRRAQGADAERPLRLRQLPPLHPDVRQRRARDQEGEVRARVRSRQARPRREDRHRPRRRRPQGDRRALQGGREEGDRASRSRRIPCSS